MQHGIPISDDTRSPLIADELVSDFRRALEYAIDLRESGSYDQALIWQQLAEFLRASENYIFSAL